MKIVIVGCGRVGAFAADFYDRTGHEVIVVDSSTSAFDRLPSTFGGHAIRGDGTDEDVLLRAGAANADVFLAVTEGDNRNVMAAQLATEALGIRRVIAKINDPLRAEAYGELGIATLCRTGLMVDAVNHYLGLPRTGLPGMLEPTGQHDGVQHDGTVPAAAVAMAGSTPPSQPGQPGQSGASASGTSSSGPSSATSQEV